MENDEHNFECMTPTVLHVQKNWHYDMSIQSNEQPGVTTLITVSKGYLVIFTQVMDNLTRSGYTFDTFSNAMCDDEFFKSCTQNQVFGVPTGYSVVIPFGTLCVCIGASTKDDDESEYTAFVFKAFHGQVPKNITEGVKLEIQTQMQKSIAANPGKTFTGRSNIVEASGVVSPACQPHPPLKFVFSPPRDCP